MAAQQPPLIISVPHSGEKIPEETPWLNGLDETVLMCDVDRFVDRLYLPVLNELKIPNVVAEWHRYAADLNRLDKDIDEMSVAGGESPGAFPVGMGVHWAETTIGDRLMPKPMSVGLHQKIIKSYHAPFHSKLEQLFSEIKSRGHSKVYHLDAHSMPSKGTKKHRDPGENRDEIVISDVDGQSCESEFKELVISSFSAAGFKVGYNWPYKGGRVTQIYGQPGNGQHSIQVELNRGLYMDEGTKQIKAEVAKGVTQKISQAVRQIFDSL